MNETLDTRWAAWEEKVEEEEEHRVEDQELVEEGMKKAYMETEECVPVFTSVLATIEAESTMSVFSITNLIDFILPEPCQELGIP